MNGRYPCMNDRLRPFSSLGSDNEQLVLTCPLFIEMFEKHQQGQLFSENNQQL